ncbi:MAG: hypothetical protein IKU70_00045 [Clostridia bacterium]|nr:hypothetical protein [Clostridia bacterium]
MTYKLCKRLAALGRLNHDMLDVYYAAGRLTGSEYAALSALIRTEGSETA